MAYDAAFPIGTMVRIVDLGALEEFERTWKLHHRLAREQLQFGGRSAAVRNIFYYHGGDVLYVLDGVPGIWHEVCLKLPP